MKLLKILIVDDKLVTLQGLRKLLPLEKLNAVIVGEAQNGERAYELAMEHKPDIVISDIRMPVMDGLELCKKLHLAVPDVVKILLTAYGDFSYAQNAIEYGVTEYILKPITKEKIDHIANKINEVSQTKIRIKSFYNFVYNTDIRNELSSALTSGDIEGIEDFFNSELKRLEQYNDTLVKEWGSILLDLYYSVIESMGNLILAQLLASKSYTWSQLLSSGNKEEVIQLVQALYLKAAGLIYTHKDSSIDTYIRLIEKYIDENYHDTNLSVRQISDMLNLTPNYISYIFSKVKGENISKYINRIRITKAKEMLCNRFINVSSIAHRAGYTNSKYFTKVFKDNEGMTPSEYRNIYYKI